MTPKAQQLGTYDVLATTNSDSNKQNGAKLQRSSQTTTTATTRGLRDDIIAKANPNTNSSASLIINRVTSVISPTVVCLVATPIALRYPLLQFIMFLTILVGTSPLYFIMITFVGKSNKQGVPVQHRHQTTHRRQPSIVGKIEEMDEKSEGKKL